MPKPSAEFAAVFRRLRAMLAPYEAMLSVVRDEADHYYLDTRTIGPNKRPIAFGGVRVGKRYVSYHLMPLYSPEVQIGMSSALKQRKQGKTCFNFAQVDDPLFRELEAVTQRCYTAWKKIEWVD